MGDQVRIGLNFGGAKTSLVLATFGPFLHAIGASFRHNRA